MTGRQRKRVCPSCHVLLPITRTGGRFRDHDADPLGPPLGPRCAGSGQVALPASAPAWKESAR